ncbi:hypothetical protein AB0P27_08890 [Microbacterium oxydans]|uniref:O-antigen ligase family protein n=1 Tax=Microbacterium oxydans TaxID=82380 RepID=UPI0034308752
MTFAYLLIFPIDRNTILLTVLLAMAIASVFVVAVDRRSLAADLRVPAILAAVVMVLGLLVGIGNEGWAHSLIAWVAAPVLFWVWAVSLTEGTIRRLFWVAVGATILLSVLVLVIAFAMPTALPRALHSVFGGDSDGAGLGAAVAIYGSSTLMFTTPMWVVGALLPSRRGLPARGWMIAAAIVGLIASLVSSRRATIVLSVAVPVIVLALYWLTRDRTQTTTVSRRSRFLIIAGVGVVILGGIAASFVPVVQRMATGVLSIVTGVARSDDERVRLEQIPELWRGFLSSPLWGNGIGATVDGFARNEDRPWAFEMQYHLLLFQVGIIGVALILGAVVLVARALWIAQRRSPEARPVLAVATAAALAVGVANVLNPLLQAPGHFWSVFLLIACINVALVSKRPAD